MNWWHVSNAFRRRYNLNFFKARNHSSFNDYDVIGFKWGRRWLSLWLKEQSVQVAKACTRQFEYIAAQRIRRSVQIFHLYTRIWDEVALREFVNIWRRHLSKNSRQLLMGAIGVSAYDWDRERIPDVELRSYSGELENIYRLRERTVTCAKCHMRLVIDVTQSGIEYCKCHGVKPALASSENGDQWQPFMEREDILVWRKEEPGNRGLYAYKVYGSFSDVCAKDFLRVQVDVDYRKEWDPTARTLEVIDTDPKMTSKHFSDVVYWEMIWPRLFANRDYVFQRRWTIDKDEGIIVIISQGTDHPKAPIRPDTHRVTTYWSYMVIKPYTDFDKPGIEFGLTYFDDPGVNIPSAVITWVAMSGLPDFLSHMRKASLTYQREQTEETEEISSESSDKENLEKRDESSASEIERKSDVKNNQASKDTNEPKTSKSEDEEKHEKNPEKETEEKRENMSEPTPDEESGFLHYFLTSRLFA